MAIYCSHWGLKRMDMGKWYRWILFVGIPYLGGCEGNHADAFSWSPKLIMYIQKFSWYHSPCFQKKIEKEKLAGFKYPIVSHTGRCVWLCNVWQTQMCWADHFVDSAAVLSPASLSLISRVAAQCVAAEPTVVCTSSKSKAIAKQWQPRCKTVTFEQPTRYQCTSRFW